MAITDEIAFSTIDWISINQIGSRWRSSGPAFPSVAKIVFLFFTNTERTIQIPPEIDEPFGSPRPIGIMLRVFSEQCFLLEQPFREAPRVYSFPRVFREHKFHVKKGIWPIVRCVLKSKVKRSSNQGAIRYVFIDSV